MSELPQYITSSIELRNIDELTPYSNNTKSHDAAQIRDLANIIKEQGFNDPITIDENGEIIKGHGRWNAAKSLGMKMVPCIVRTDLTPEQIRAMRIADNLIARRGKIDDEILKAETIELVNMDVDLSLLGFSDDEIADVTEKWLQIDLDLDDLSSLLDAELSKNESAPAAPPSMMTDSLLTSLSEKEKDYAPTYNVVVTCADETDQRKVYEQMREQGYACKVQLI